MGVIHQTADGRIFIGDKNRPVDEDGVFHCMFKDLFDASAVTGVAIKDIVTAADDGDGKVAGGKYKFSWPTLRSVQKHFPNYTTAQIGGFQPAKPTTVHTRTPGAHSTRDTLNFRSITSARDRFQLTPRAFDKIVNQEEGWEKLLPGIVTKIEIHEPGWKPRDQVFVEGVGGGPMYFECRQTKGGILIAYIGPKKVKRAREVPAIVDGNCEWKG